MVVHHYMVVVLQKSSDLILQYLKKSYCDLLSAHFLNFFREMGTLKDKEKSYICG